VFKHYQNSDPLSRVYMEETLNTIKTSIQQEQSNAKLFCRIQELVDQDEKELVNKIIVDEREHVQTLRWLYINLTGKNLDVKNDFVDTNLDLFSAIKKCISIEISTIENYNKLHNHLNDITHKNIMQKIINDESKNFNILNYLLIITTK
jgi:rubrerythrin